MRLNSGTATTAAPSSVTMPINWLASPSVAILALLSADT